MRPEVMVTIITGARVDKERQGPHRPSCIIIPTHSSCNRKLYPVESHTHGLLQGLHPLIDSHITHLEIITAAQVLVFLEDRLLMVCDAYEKGDDARSCQATQYITHCMTRFCKPTIFQQGRANKQRGNQVSLLLKILFFIVQESILQTNPV